MPSEATTVVAVLVGVAIAVVLFPPLTSAVNDNSGAVDVTNESITALNGSYVELDGYNIHDGSETVYWLNSSTSSYETTTAYTLNESAGTILIDTSGSISAGDDVKVSYTYQATDGATTSIVVLVPTFAALLALVYVGNEITERM